MKSSLLADRLREMIDNLCAKKPDGYGETRDLWPEEKEEFINLDLLKHAYPVNAHNG